MFITLVAQSTTIMLTVWVGKEKNYTRTWNTEEYEQRFSDPVSLAGVIQETCDWLNRQGLQSVRAIVWQRRQVEIAGFEFFAEGLAEALKGISYEVPFWFEDRLPEIAQISGLPGIVRRGVYDKAAHEAAIYQTSLELGYTPNQFIVANLSEGVTVAAYSEGQLLDVNNARDGEGPMGLTTTGNLPTELLIHWAYTSGEDLAVLEGKLNHGGWAAYEGNISKAEWESILAYQVLKEIGAMRAVLKQKAELVILTGKLTFSEKLIGTICGQLPLTLPVKIVPRVDVELGLARIWTKEEAGEVR